MVDTANNAAYFTFDTAGTYVISLYGLNRCFDATGTRTIVVKAPPVVNIGPDTAICTGEQITLFNDSSNSTWTYQWKTSTAQLGTNDSLTVSPTATTSYILEVNSGVNAPSQFLAYTHCKLRDTVTVTVDQPSLSSFQDSICAGDTVVLDQGTAISYLWNNGDTTQQQAVTDTGTYTVNVQMASEVCYRIYSYTVGTSYPDSSEQNAFICSGDPLILNATEPGATYLWNTGETTSQITINSVGTYYVIVTSPSRGCPITKTYHAMEVPDSCDRDFKLPNVFTPGSTLGLNDYFEAVTFGTYHSFLIKIFNRWGELVFESNDQYFQWDGNNKQGKECPAGVYYYVGQVSHPQDTRQLHGFVTLIRDKD
jgi:gliding motility-associated-like protein